MYTSPDSPRGALLAQYVRARITNMKGIDIGLFDFDRHNAIYYFILNADEDIYLRYGGRDVESAVTYLDESSLSIALELGLEKHKLFTKGEAKPSAKPKPLFPRDIVSLNKEVVQENNCVECHLIADFHAIDLEAAGKLSKPQDMYKSPDLKKIGIYLDIPRGLVIKKAPGLETGDLITNLNGIEVLTFADLQYHLDKVDRQEKQIRLSVRRNDELLTVPIDLQPEWWVTDLTHRYWSVDPQLYFNAEALSADEKKALKLPAGSFASRVTEVDINALLSEAHTLEEEDVIIAVDEVQKDELTQNITTYLKLNYQAGNSLTLDVLRNEKPLKLKVETGRQSYRK